MTTICDPRVREYLSYGTRTGKLAMTAADGRPLVVPIWFIVDGDEIVFNTGAESTKAKAFARDPRVALVVDTEELPYAFVQVQGRVTLSADPVELLETATTIAARYMGTDRAEEFGRRNAVPGEVVVRLHPTRVTANFDVTG